MSDDESRLERGNRVRREVLGDAHVDRSMLRATEFTRVVQEFVTASCWGDVWSRPGLDRRTRSLLNLAMLTALNRPHEFSVHVRGALRNGCTEAEIQEVLLQTAVYCGAPAALESFRHAERVIEDVRQEAALADEAVGIVAG
ncbi:carboxymuconolactone decarboxylase family protein [Dactylosporangium sp. AC04546]|uniref:carboxymuconolactone decarboxylase family protein n=1 Tax=Dactylosporangium sp. AC04546 TaxID=2862460 RepID=UPI001EDE76E9|nr:carboxymuconolactone decarboxylase family protein [Dactylosporangium sp. AC04546]WVK89133.1 carboxymuconolactone decarboxylase family protein [Dactylosporangium sp. AC04546]